MAVTRHELDGLAHCWLGRAPESARLACLLHDLEGCVLRIRNMGSQDDLRVLALGRRRQCLRALPSSGRSLLVRGSIIPEFGSQGVLDS